MVTLQSLVVVLLSISAFAVVSSGQKISPRMMNGIPADTVKRFPHHVSIQPLFNGRDWGEVPSCGGSIIGGQWVLTSLRCVEQGDRLRVDFEKLYKNSTKGSYSAVVNNDDDWVIKYPTKVDDLALIKIPLLIRFSDTVNQIGLSSRSPDEMAKELVVMPGFDTNGRDQLTYSMFTVVSNEVCMKSYSVSFDPFLDMCAQPKSTKTACATDYGSGLIVGWPRNPYLVGVFSSISKDCDYSNPSAFTNIEKYLDWIFSIIYKDQGTTTSTTVIYT